MDERVVIYGAYGAIGSAVARLVHARGGRLHLVGRDERRLSALATELEARYTIGDVLDEELSARVLHDVGDPVTGLVYAVGTINLKGVSQLSTEDYLHDYRVNAVGAAHAVKAVLGPLKAGGRGAVVLFSSVAARQGFAMHASIGMAKGAVSALTLSLAAELAPRVRVNAVAPSLTETPLAAGLLRNERVRDSLAAFHPIPRLGSAEDSAYLAAFLLSAHASWITGQIIGVDGGRATLRTKS